MKTLGSPSTIEFVETYPDHFVAQNTHSLIEFTREPDGYWVSRFNGEIDSIPFETPEKLAAAVLAELG